jgi:hypothetical protein
MRGVCTTGTTVSRNRTVATVWEFGKCSTTRSHCCASLTVICVTDTSDRDAQIAQKCLQGRVVGTDHHLECKLHHYTGALELWIPAGSDPWWCSSAWAEKGQGNVLTSAASVCYPVFIEFPGTVSATLELAARRCGAVMLGITMMPMMCFSCWPAARTMLGRSGCKISALLGLAAYVRVPASRNQHGITHCVYIIMPYLQHQQGVPRSA